MDENINNNPEQLNDPNLTQDYREANAEQRNFTTPAGTDLYTDRGGAAAAAAYSRTNLILGWISAALTFLISPYFAIAGIVFGVLVNRQAKGHGNALIITNIALAVLNILTIRLIMGY